MSDASAEVLAPPPWSLHATAYTLFCWLPKRMGPREQFVPDGARGRDGGPALVALVRYLDSPVGPYDELLFMPLYGVQIAGAWCTSFTKIYVSTEASVRNGRRNWGIPKERARFEWEYEPADVHGVRGVRARVYALEGPCFAELSLCTWGRCALPVSTCGVPAALRTTTQLYEGARYAMAVQSRASVRRARVRALDFDPASFPAVTASMVCSTAHMPSVSMRYPTATVTKLA